MSRKCKGKCGLRNVCGNAAKVLQKVEVRSKRCGSREFWLNRGERGEGGGIPGYSRFTYIWVGGREGFNL